MRGQVPLGNSTELKYCLNMFTEPLSQHKIVLSSFCKYIVVGKINIKHNCNIWLYRILKGFFDFTAIFFLSHFLF